MRVAVSKENAMSMMMHTVTRNIWKGFFTGKSGRQTSEVFTAATLSLSDNNLQHRRPRQYTVYSQNLIKDIIQCSHGL